MEKVKNVFAGYRIATILFTAMTVLYYCYYIITPVPKSVHVYLIFLFILPLNSLYYRLVRRSGIMETISYAILLNLSALLFLPLNSYKKQYISISNLLNTTNFFILLTMWLYQLNIHFSFLNGILIKGFIVMLFATLLLFMNSKVVDYSRIKIDDEENEDEDEVKPKIKEKIKAPNAREAHPKTN